MTIEIMGITKEELRRNRSLMGIFEPLYPKNKEF